MDERVWPHVAIAAAEAAIEDPEAVPAFIEGFAQRWGGVDQKAFIAALLSGVGDDRFAALQGLRLLDTAFARASLLTSLDDGERAVQCVGATYLAQLGDTRALPVLRSMLLEGLPETWAEFLRLAQEEAALKGWFNPYYLAALQDKEAIPTLRHALDTATQLAYEGGLFAPAAGITIEDLPTRREEMVGSVVTTLHRAMHPNHVVGAPLRRSLNPTFEVFESPGFAPHVNGAIEELGRYANRIVYALGSLGTSDVLDGIAVPELFVRLWRVTLALGSLHGQVAMSDVRSLVFISPESSLTARLDACLEKQFGMGSEERLQAIALFGVCTALHFSIELDYLDHVTKRAEL